jgi:predicted transcriptional regulator
MTEWYSLTVRLPDEMYEAVRDRAVAEDRSVVSLIRQAIAAYLGWDYGPIQIGRLGPAPDDA